MKTCMKASMIVLLLSIFTVACSSSPTAQQAGAGSNGKESGNAENGFGNRVAPLQATISTATVGGFWYTLGGAISDIVQKNIPGSQMTVIEGGTIGNIMGVNDGKFEYGMAMSQSIIPAVEGKEPFDKKLEKVRVVAAMYDAYFQMLVRNDSDIYQVEDLRGKRIATGPKGYAGEQLTRELLQVYGMSYDDMKKVDQISTADANSNLGDKNTDMVDNLLPLPDAGYKELDTTVGTRLVGVPEDRIVELQKMNSGYSIFKVPAETYSGNQEEITVPGAVAVLFTSADRPEKEVYALTKAIMEHTEQFGSLSATMKNFNAEYAVKSLVGPLHPGAEKYYKEAGILK